MMDTFVKVAGDVLSSSVIVATVLQLAPFALAVPSAIYACLRIWEWWEQRVARKGQKNQAAYIAKYRSRDQARMRALKPNSRKGK